MDDLKNRLQTFTDWPQHVAVKPKDLAESGFHYVGEGPDDDMVSCFACGGMLNHWQAGDIPEQRHREYFGEFCPFVGDVLDSPLSNATPNIDRYDPIEDDDMENEEQRLRSFGRNNGWKALVDPQKLAAAGFYFTGIDDNVRCFACDVCLSRWEAEDDPITEHLRNQSDCPFLSRLTNLTPREGMATSVYQYNRPNYTETVKITRKPQSAFRSALSALSEPKAPVQVEDHYQGQPSPVHVPPNYANEHARLHSFINWPKECPVRPKELIDAGFYYTGEEDKTKCFRCGVILAGWEPEDTPWGEHERWSQDCHLVKEHLLRRMPHSLLGGNREIPQFPKEQSWKSPKEGFAAGKSMDSVPRESEYLGDATANTSWLPTEQRKETESQEKSEVFEFHIQKAIQELVDLRYNLATVEEAIKQKEKVCGESINSTKELLDAVHSYMGKTKGKKHAIPSESTKSIRDPKTNISPDDEHAISEKATELSLVVDPKTLHRQLVKIQEARSCSICFDADVGVVFRPCGHLVCCPTCAIEIQSKHSPLCPVCRTHIEDTIQIYFS